MSHDHYVVCHQLQWVKGPYEKALADKLAEKWNSRLEVEPQRDRQPGECSAAHEVMDHNPYSSDPEDHEGR